MNFRNFLNEQQRYGANGAPAIRHMSHFCALLGSKSAIFALEIASRLPRGKFAGKSETSGRWQNPWTDTVARKCLIRAPESIAFAPEIGGFALVLGRF